MFLGIEIGCEILKYVQLVHYFFYHISVSNCRTSLTDRGYNEKYKTGNKGKLNATCQFPFKYLGKTYYTCTYDYGYVTEHKPWCSTKTDENFNHVIRNWGVCDDEVNCYIPERSK